MPVKLFFNRANDFTSFSFKNRVEAVKGEVIFFWKDGDIDQILADLRIFGGRSEIMHASVDEEFPFFSWGNKGIQVPAGVIKKILWAGWRF